MLAPLPGTDIFAYLLGMLINLLIEGLIIVEGILLQFINPGPLSANFVIVDALTPLGDVLVAALANIMVKVVAFVEYLLDVFGFGPVVLP